MFGPPECRVVCEGSNWSQTRATHVSLPGFQLLALLGSPSFRPARSPWVVSFSSNKRTPERPRRPHPRHLLRHHRRSLRYLPTSPERVSNQLPIRDQTQSEPKTRLTRIASSTTTRIELARSTSEGGARQVRAPPRIGPADVDDRRTVDGPPRGIGRDHNRGG
jgi:hypothetical protein